MTTRSPAQVAAVVAAATTLLSGCSSGADQSGAAASPQSSETVQTQSSPAAAPSWSPSVPYVAPTYSEAEALQIRDDYLKSLRPEGAPDVAVVRWMGSHDEQAAMLVTCMADQGFAMEQNGSSIQDSGPVPDSQQAAYETAMYVCNAQYPLEPKFMVDFTAEQWGIQYDYWVESMIPCLEANGVPQDHAAVPTREAFIAQRTGPVDPNAQVWTPNFSDDPPTYIDDQGFTREVCPQIPPGDALFG